MMTMRAPFALFALGLAPAAQAATALPPAAETPAPQRAAPPARPQPLVKRGEPVVIAVRSAGLLITSQGRALGSAGEGEAIRVISLSTHRTLDGVVDGPGSVRIPLR
jgi:flagellar basal body P-ring formation protein FlgA